MPLFISKLKLTAASRSMHQFLPQVRVLFPASPDDAIVEAATAFLYQTIAQEVFGARFGAALRARLRDTYKFAEVLEIDRAVERIDSQRASFERARRDEPAEEGAFAVQVHCAIRALLAEAGMSFDDHDLVKQLFPHFEETARRIKMHLDGIKKQSTFVMKS